jgi:hypothetical protein
MGQWRSIARATNHEILFVKKAEGIASGILGGIAPPSVSFNFSATKLLQLSAEILI